MVLVWAKWFEEDQVKIPGINVIEDVDITEEAPPLEAEEVTPEPVIEVPAPPIEWVDIVRDREEIIEPEFIEAPAPPELTRETFRSIQDKIRLREELTEAEKRLAARVATLTEEWQTQAQIFWEEEVGVEAWRLRETEAEDLANKIITWDKSLREIWLWFSPSPAQIEKFLRSQWFSDTQVKQVRDTMDRIRREEKITVTWEEAISAAELAIDERLAAQTERLTEQAEKRVQTQQRLRSQRGLGRSSATEEIILEEEKARDSLINQANAVANAEKAIFKAQQEGKDAVTIAALQKSFTQQQIALDTQLQDSIAAQKEADAAINATFRESVDNLISTLSLAWVEIWEFDEKATEALWYISDSKGNPLKLDEEWNPIAPKNEFGIDAKISTFKDANDNVFVYKNGQLSSIVQNDGTILTWDQLKTVKVPAGVKADQAAKQQRDTETRLRKEFNNNSQIKRFGTIKSSFQRVESWKDADTAAWDLALIFAFMKMLDPASVVRESEFATAANAAWVPERVRNIYNRINTWERLGKDQRQDFFGRAQDIFKKETENATIIRDQFVRIAEDVWARTDFITWAFEELADIRPPIDIEWTPDSILDSLTGKVTEKEVVEEEPWRVTITRENTFEEKSSFLDEGLDRADQTAIPKGVQTREFNNRDVTLDSSVLDSFTEANNEFKNQFGSDIKLWSEITASTRTTEQQQKLFWQWRSEEELIQVGFNANDAKRFASPDENIITNSDWIKNKSKHQEWTAIDIRLEDIARAKPILEKFWFKQTIPEWDAGHFELITELNT